MIYGIPNDKLTHCLVGSIIYDCAFPVTGKLALIAVLIAAIGKEIYDYFHKDVHTPDAWDAVATVAGGLLAAVTGFM